MAKKPGTTDQPPSAGDTPAQIRRAEELRREIAEIAKGGTPAGKPTPREMTDAAARAKAGKTED
ncbi:hypothetical protein [Mesorhizobium huakuii]|uniref:Uncharacterized protein n=1 Tax=Mesorhizobium huakuii TaxID=28104 RepID=A0A7G6SMI1_9HYPH|nr:hypothetical protein [Mesorhizobium huakuii]QND55713.1 hypothetical protein HB778_02810 [Mesorhizobium huakuii]